MADELDPRLEASLRAALHHEADQLPLLIRSEDIERARRRRGGRRFALPASLLGLAAVLAILVATGGIGRLLQGNVAASPSPLPTATDRPLASYELLLGMLGVAKADLQGEQPASATAGDPVTVELGTLTAPGSVRYAIHCLGGPVTLVLDDGGPNPDIVQTDCAAQPVALDLQGSASPYRVSVTASPAVGWRIVLVASAGAAGIPPDCVPLSGGSTGRSLDINNGARLSMPIDSIGTLAWHTFEGATVAGADGNVPALGGPLLVNLADGLLVDPGQHCFGGVTAAIVPFDVYEAARAAGVTPSFTSLPVDGRTDTSAITVRLRGAGTQLAGGQVIRLTLGWNRSDGKEDTETWLLPVEVTRTGIVNVLAFDDLAMYSGDTVELLRSEHVATGSAAQVVAGDLGAPGTVEVVLSCDTGAVELRFQAAGQTYPIAGTVDCAQPVVGLVLPSPVPQGTAAQLVVDAPGGTTWRLIAYDHDAGRKPSIEEALPLPAPRPGQTVEGVIMGLVAGGAPAGNTLQVSAGPQGTTFEVVYACDGAGDIHVTVEGLTKDAACASTGSLSFTPSGFGPSVLTVTSDRTVLLHLELRSSAP